MRDLANRIKKLEKSMHPPTDIPYLTPVEMALSAHIELDPWQADLVSSTENRILVNCSRQSGKSLSAAIIAVWTAQYVEEATVLLLSPSLRQSSELFKKCMHVFNHLEYRLPVRSESALRLELSNNSRIVSLPGKEGTIRGFSSVDLLILDEASRIDDSLYFSAKPFLAVSNGRLLLLSTPNGSRGVFYEAWKDRRNWQYYEVTADQCPRISEEFLEKERKDIGEYWMLQEYYCVFQDSQQSAFRSEDIESIIDPNLEAWDFSDLDTRNYYKPAPVEKTYEAWDL